MLYNLEPKQKTAILSGILVGMFLSALTSTVVSTAMPTIIADLGGMEYLSWALTAYMLSSTVSMPIAGKLSDMFGRKPFYIGGILIFLLGNILCGTSHSLTSFVIYRAIAGIGGGVMQANAMTIIADLYPPAKRGKYQGMIGAVFGIASVIGPVTGGYITDQWDWHWVFWINIPIGLIAIFILAYALPGFTLSNRKAKIDYAGAAFLIAAFTPMLIAFTWAGAQYDWLSAPVLSLLGVSLLALIVFRHIEKRAAEPIIPLTLFHNRIFNVSVITAFLMSVSMFGTLMYIPMYIQGVKDYSASGSGIAIAPMMGGMVLATVVSGQIVTRTGKYKKLIIAGFIIMTLSMVMLSIMNEHSSVQVLILSMVFFGIGLGTAIPIFVVVVQSAFPHSQVGIVTAGLQFFRSIGGTFGVALMGSIINTRFGDAALDLLPASTRKNFTEAELNLFKTPQALFNQDTVTEVLEAASPENKTIISAAILNLRAVLSDAFHHIFLLSVIVIAAALILSFFLEEIPLRSSNHTPAEQSGMEMMADGSAIPGIIIPVEGQPDILDGTDPPHARPSRSAHRSAPLNKP